ncbi:hypothetical protein [uncultured Jatrophihabitans sp.]|uniref:hypothetical protein n=1 Tax=uncultured Jatrophihabitans sp. TaxID=1610747 RepID=UPI0035CB98EC
MSGQLLVRCEREWPWGMFVIDDAGLHAALPDWPDYEQLVGTDEAVLVPVMHAVDGPVVVELWAGPAESGKGWSCVWDAPLSLPSGVARVGDAEWSMVAPSALRAGTWRLRVLVDREQHSEHVRIVFTELG